VRRNQFVAALSDAIFVVHAAAVLAAYRQLT